MSEKAKEKLTEFFKPMLCEEGAEKDLDNPSYIGTLKVDGTRCVIERTESGFQIFGKRGLTYTNILPELENLAKIPQLFRLDGEIVYIDSDGHQVFRGSQIRCQISNSEKVKEYAKLYPIGVFLFDITMLNGVDLTQLPFIKRFTILTHFLKLYSELLDLSNVRLIPISMEKRKMYEWAKENGLEGLVLRLINGKYEVGKRSKNATKVKCREHTLFVLKGEYHV